ncbi:MAG: polysaccharide deacetylase family protein [Lachnospiraceae bacterium]|nr:polysaccharide deacetylase family protein [Lachnospiraceae bacterium]
MGEKINDETAEVMRRTVNMGCELENHSFTHSAMPSLSSEERIFEVKRTSELIEKYTGAKVRYFRPPYIAVDEVSAKDIKYPFICGVGCDDWDENVSVETRIEMVLKNAEEGQIILLHDTDYNVKTYEAVKVIIPELINRGYELVTVDELFMNSEEDIEVGTGRLYSVIK